MVLTLLVLIVLLQIASLLVAVRILYAVGKKLLLHAAITHEADERADPPDPKAPPVSYDAIVMHLIGDDMVERAEINAHRKSAPPLVKWGGLTWYLNRKWTDGSYEYRTTE
jgi:hypothetical protein